VIEFTVKVLVAASDDKIIHIISFALCFIARLSDETDAKKILTASHLQNWRRPPGCTRSMWMKTIQQDLKFNDLSLNETIDVAQNCSFLRLMSTFDAMHF